MAVIFVGNGINQNEELVYSWEELLDNVVNSSQMGKSKSSEIVSAPEKTIQRPKVEGLSMTMSFEFLEFFAVDHHIVESGYELKKRIAKVIRARIRKRVKEVDFDWNNTVHARLMRMPVETYLTTNYDYTLEQSVWPDFKRKSSTREIEYSRMRYQTVNVDGRIKTVYHIHGEEQAPNSICLGFEHYAGTLEKMRSDLLRGTHDWENEKDPHTYHLKDILTRVDSEDNCWYLKMFTEDVYILGFNIEFAEQDIWWLLDYRYRKIRDGKLPIKNHIYYIDVDKIEDREKICNKARNAALSQFGIEVRLAKGEDYPSRYNWALGWIEGKLQ